MLERYSRVIDGKALPRFKIAKRVACRPALSPGLGDLMEEQGLLEGVFGNAVRRSDAGEVLSKAGRSLLDLNAEIALRSFSSCDMCGLHCQVDRKKEKGVCGIGGARIARVFKQRSGPESFFLPCASVLFSGCNFKCVFCNAWDISQFPEHGKLAKPLEVAREIEGLRGVKSLFISGGEPLANLRFMLELLASFERNLAVILDSNLYASDKAMSLLESLVDVYVADLKFGDEACASRLAGVKDYWAVVSRNVARIDEGSLVIRHVVLPGHFECCTRKILDWAARERPLAAFALRGDYSPAYKSALHKGIENRLSAIEFKKARDYAVELGLRLVE